jgi:hypothetical protein
MSTPKPQDLLDSIADAAGREVAKLILGMRDEITEAITACVENAQDEADRTTEAKHAVLTLPVSIKWDLDTRAVQVSLAVAIKRKATADIVLEDPAQPNLPLTLVHEEDYTEDELRDRDGDAMPNASANAVRRMAKAIRDGGATVTVTTNTEATR